MKRILRIGDCYALTTHKLNPYTIRYISLLAVLTTMCLYAVKQVSAQQAEPAATAVANIEPLQIGDTIPEYLWQLPLQLNEHQGNYRTVRLADYRGKLILLDFWALWCSSCIKALPKLSELQAGYAADIAALPVVKSGPEAVSKFRKRNEITRKLKLPIVVSDTLLSSYFPHRTISHIAWISPEGKLISTTGSDPVEPRTIVHILNGGKPYWAPKIDAVAFDYEAPLFRLGTHLVQNGGQPTYFAGLTGYQPGVSPKVRIQVDSSARTVRATAINQSLYQLILQSLGLSRTSFPANQVNWQVNDLSRYVQPKSVYKEDWNRAHIYCYEYTMSINDVSWRQTLRADLMRYFPGMAFSADTGIYDCLVLVRTGSEERFRSTTAAKLLAVDANSSVKILRNCPVGTLINVLNKHILGMAVYNGTDFDGNIDIELPIPDLSDIDAIRRALKAYDLDLVPDRREYVRVTVKDQPDTFRDH